MKRWIGFGLVLLTASFCAAEDALPVPTGIPTHGRTYTIAGLPQSDYTMDAVYTHGTLTPLTCAGTAAYIIAPKGAVDSERRWIWISNLFLALNDIEHTRTKTRHPQTNGICERFNKTCLNEFYQIAFRKKVYETVGALQEDLDAWLEKYNTRRTHQGKRCQGRTPMATFLENLPEARAKLDLDGRGGLAAAG